jgi:hypothetical protein
VLSTMRQVGSLMGIAILGAVLQNRITANLTSGLEAVAGIPAALKQKILDGFAAGGMQMGMPSGTDSAPAAVRQVMAALFQTSFTDAINTTFVVGVAFALGGAVCALLLRGKPQKASLNPISAEAQGEASPPITGNAPVVTPDHT